VFNELLVAWRGFPVGEATWELYSVMAVDVPGMVADIMESHEDIDAVREMRSLPHHHGTTPCDKLVRKMGIYVIG
jgi:hypothetical protein